MPTLRPFVSSRALLLGLLLATSSCRNYSSVREIRPKYQSSSPAGQMIVQAMKRPAKEPPAQIGSFLDAASAATTILEKAPGNRQALADYNFAVARIFEVIHAAKLEPWRAPLVCPGRTGDWSFFVKSEKRPDRNPSNFRVLPADRYEFSGSLVGGRTVKQGLGAPMVATSEGFDPTKFDPFIQGKTVYYGLTEVIHFNGRSCTAVYVDPLAAETVEFAGHTFPLGADFTAPIGLALAELKPGRQEIKRLVRPEEFAASTRLARFQPYDPKKIPILCIHGLGDSQATWAPLIESLRGDATFRKNYQVWFFSYPTGYPYPLMAAVLRNQMDAINARYPDHKPVVVIGHSMGGMIARELMTDSGMTIWNAYFDMPPERLPFSKETRRTITDALIFRHRPEISRVIFLSASLRGADMATSFFGRLGAKIIGSSAKVLGPPDEETEALRLAKPNADGEQLKALPNSVEVLNPNNRFLTTINTIPLVKGIPYHSIIGDRGKGGNLSHAEPVSSDGIVPYWSSHLDGAESELIIPSGHWSNQHPMGIAEVHRILLKHIGRK